MSLLSPARVTTTMNGANRNELNVVLDVVIEKTFWWTVMKRREMIGMKRKMTAQKHSFVGGSFQ